MKLLKKILIVAAVLLGLMILASVLYLIWLFVTVVIPLIPQLLYAMLK